MYNNVIKDWFYFTRQQRRGILVMLILIVALPLMGRLISTYLRHSGINDEAVQLAMNEFEQHLEHVRKEKERLAEKMEAERKAVRQRSEADYLARLEPRRFDPNALSLEEWTSMGVSSRIGRSIRNYLAAGGSFRFKQDLKRIYVMDDNLYEELEPWITLPDREAVATTAPDPVDSSSLPHSPSETGILKDQDENRQDVTATADASGKMGHSANGSPPGRGHAAEPAKGFAEREPVIIHLNKADTTDLQGLRGIGPVFSRRIARYRDLLGGYSCTSQLLEVFGMDSARFYGIKPYIKTDTGTIRKIDINRADFGDLVRHPYVEQPVASAILNMRDQHGFFNNVGEIKQSYLIDEVLWERLKPYLHVGEME